MKLLPPSSPISTGVQCGVVPLHECPAPLPELPPHPSSTAPSTMCSSFTLLLCSPNFPEPPRLKSAKGEPPIIQLSPSAGEPGIFRPGSGDDAGRSERKPLSGKEKAALPTQRSLPPGEFLCVPGQHISPPRLPACRPAAQVHRLPQLLL